MQERIQEFIRLAYENNILIKNEKETFFKKLLPFEKEETIKKADELMLDIINTPHAYVLGCVMDLGIQAERAWIIPYKVFSAFMTMGHIKNYSIDDLVKVPYDKYKEVFFSYYGKSLHRFNKMVERFYNAVLHIRYKYNGNAALIWQNKPSSKEVVYRFREFIGIGQKISTMATNILFRKFDVEFSEKSYIDISVDIHVIRVMKRLGFVDYNSKERIFKENILRNIRKWNSGYPGIFDRICFTVGRTWCHECTLECGNCILKDICYYIRSG